LNFYVYLPSDWDYWDLFLLFLIFTKGGLSKCKTCGDCICYDYSYIVGKTPKVTEFIIGKVNPVLPDSRLSAFTSMGSVVLVESVFSEF
jgi:hypothetical protein